MRASQGILLCTLFWQLLPVFPENGNPATRFDQNQPGQWFGA
jgi:hypothetical protein